MDTNLTKHVLRTYPILKDVPTHTLDACLQHAKPVHLDRSTVIFRRGEMCSSFPLVLDGAVRIQRLSREGREITLRHVHPGETCELGTACLLAEQCYPIEGVVEVPLDAVFLSKHQFAMLLSDHAFKNYIYGSIASGLSTLLTLVEDLAFGALDRRLAQCLRALADGDAIPYTHEELAKELGTAREVVSRTLKEFERRGWVQLRRGNIVICDQKSLRAIAAAPGV